jgi:hypothetical protein
MASRSSSSRRRSRAPSAAALLLLAATAAVVVAPHGAAARPLHDPATGAAQGAMQATQHVHGAKAADLAGAAEMPASPGLPARGGGMSAAASAPNGGANQAAPSWGNYAVAAGPSTREGYAASATGGAVGALWPQAMANSARVGGGPFSGYGSGFGGGGAYGRDGFYYGRDRTNWPNHSAGSMAVAGGQTAAIASTGRASSAAFGGKRRLMFQ